MIIACLFTQSPSRTRPSRAPGRGHLIAPSSFCCPRNFGGSTFHLRVPDRPRRLLIGPSVVRSDRRAEAAPTLRRPVAFPVWEDPPWSDQVHFADPWHSQCGRTLRGPIRSPRGGGSYSSPTRGIPSCGRTLRGPIRFTSPTRGIPSVGGPSVVRSDRRAEAAPTLCRPVAFPVWEDPPWSDQVHFADPWHSQCRRTLRGPIRSLWGCKLKVEG